MTPGQEKQQGRTLQWGWKKEGRIGARSLQSIFSALEGSWTCKASEPRSAPSNILPRTGQLSRPAPRIEAHALL